MAPRVIAVTGGIGSGKSVVSDILRTLGYPVYDCDANAKWLMDTSAGIKQKLIREICPEAVNNDGTINRAAIAQVVFNNPEKLASLNNIVHGTVVEHLKQRIADSVSPIFFFETAILQTSGLNALVDEEWHVTAPEALRVKRVMARNGLTAQQVKARMANQNENPGPGTKILTNDGQTPLLPQILALLA